MLPKEGNEERLKSVFNFLLHAYMTSFRIRNSGDSVFLNFSKYPIYPAPTADITFHISAQISSIQPTNHLL